MVTSSRPKPYPAVARIGLALLALLLIALTFKVMSALSSPSLYLNAYKTATKGPGKTSDLQKLSIFNPNQYLYLVGPVLPASGHKQPEPLFIETPGAAGCLRTPSVFSDQDGAVEVLAATFPYTEVRPNHYQTNTPYHLLGRKSSQTGIELFMIADSHEGLMRELEERTRRWKQALFFQGLLLAIVVFTIFWLLNIVILSNPALQAVQFFIVNVVFLILFYSVLILSSYPLVETLLLTLAILALANGSFLALSRVVQLLKRPRQEARRAN